MQKRKLHNSSWTEVSHRETLPNYFYRIISGHTSEVIKTNPLFKRCSVKISFHNRNQTYMSHKTFWRQQLLCIDSYQWHRRNTGYAKWVTAVITIAYVERNRQGKEVLLKQWCFCFDDKTSLSSPCSSNTPEVKLFSENHLHKISAL